MITAVIVSYKREANLPIIIDSLKHKEVSEIIVFNNNPDMTVAIDNVIVINSKKNFKCWAKYVIASMITTDYVLSIDDDLYLREGAIDILLKYTQKDLALGVMGLNIINGKYSIGERVNGKKITENKKVDILLGRMILTTPERMSKAIYMRNQIEGWKEKPYLATESEDIVLSFGGDNIVVSGNLIGDLSEHNISLHKREHHALNRDMAVEDLLTL